MRTAADHPRRPLEQPVEDHRTAAVDACTARRKQCTAGCRREPSTYHVHPVMQRHHRRSIRLPGFDYARPAAYFLTLCAHERRCLFGAVVEGRMRLDGAGEVVADEWIRSEKVRGEIIPDAFVVMPNHFHGIVLIVPPDTDAAAVDLHGYRVAPLGEHRGERFGADAGDRRSPLRGAAPRSLGAFVAGFKSSVTRRVNHLRGTPGGRVWQRNYYERILRDEREWRLARRYIEQNPIRWTEDRLFAKRR